LGRKRERERRAEYAEIRDELVEFEEDFEEDEEERQ
jgi:hypothetical protein